MGIPPKPMGSSTAIARQGSDGATPKHAVGPYIVEQGSNIVISVPDEKNGSQYLGERICECNPRANNTIARQRFALRLPKKLAEKLRTLANTDDICLDQSARQLGTYCLPVADSTVIDTLARQFVGNDNQSFFCSLIKDELLEINAPCAAFKNSLAAFSPRIAKVIEHEAVFAVKDVSQYHKAKKDSYGILRLADDNNLLNGVPVNGEKYSTRMWGFTLPDKSAYEAFLSRTGLSEQDLQLQIMYRDPVFTLTTQKGTMDKLTDLLTSYELPFFGKTDYSCDRLDVNLDEQSCQALIDHVDEYNSLTTAEEFKGGLIVGAGFVIAGLVLEARRFFGFLASIKKYITGKGNNDDDQTKPPPPVAPGAAPKSEPSDAPEGGGNIEFQMQPEPMILVMAMKMVAEALRQLPTLAPRLAMQSAGLMGSGMSWAANQLPTMARIAQGSVQVAAQTAMQSATAATATVAGETGLLSMLAPAGLLAFSGAVGVMWANDGRRVLENMPKEAHESAMKSLMSLKSSAGMMQ